MDKPKVGQELCRIDIHPFAKHTGPNPTTVVVTRVGRLSGAFRWGGNIKRFSLDNLRKIADLVGIERARLAE